MNVFDELRWREMIYDASEGIEEALTKPNITTYIGFDPTAPSLHVGSLLPIMALVHLQHYGHTPIALVGGGTGMIGDPSGKTQERLLLSKEQVEFNLEGIRKQLSLFVDFEAPHNPAIILNNADWLLSMNLVDFLRDIGKYFTINYMMAKESIRRRFESGEGISFTEFSYMLLQAYDFLTLYDRYSCSVQMGGSDQWGNIVAGIELIRRMRGEKAYGLVLPLVTASSGVKFGKTEAGTIWLDPNLTSPFHFYQFWINTDDRDVIRYLKYFTLLNQGQIAELETALAVAPEKREAQKRLAEEVTLRVHGEAALQKAIQASQALFGEEITNLSAREVLDIFAEVPSSNMEKALFEGHGLPILNLITASGLTASRGEARRLIEGGGFYINNRRITDIGATVGFSSLIEGQYLVLRKGVRQYHLIQVS